MRFTWRKKVGSLILAATITMGSFAGIGVFALGENIEVVLQDVTSSSATTLAGEAKIKVSIKGVRSIGKNGFGRNCKGFRRLR